MANQDMQGGTGTFVVKVIVAIVLFIALVTYVVKQNGEALL